MNPNPVTLDNLALSFGSYFCCSMWFLFRPADFDVIVHAGCLSKQARMLQVVD